MEHVNNFSLVRAHWPRFTDKVIIALSIDTWFMVAESIQQHLNWLDLSASPFKYLHVRSETDINFATRPAKQNKNGPLSRHTHSGLG